MYAMDSNSPVAIVVESTHEVVATTGWSNNWCLREILGRHTALEINRRVQVSLQPLATGALASFAAVL